MDIVSSLELSFWGALQTIAQTGRELVFRLSDDVIMSSTCKTLCSETSELSPNADQRTLTMQFCDDPEADALTDYLTKTQAMPGSLSRCSESVLIGILANPMRAPDFKQFKSIVKMITEYSASKPTVMARLQDVQNVFGDHIMRANDSGEINELLFYLEELPGSLTERVENILFHKLSHPKKLDLPRLFRRIGRMITKYTAYTEGARRRFQELSLLPIFSNDERYYLGKFAKGEKWEGEEWE